MREIRPPPTPLPPFGTPPLPQAHVSIDLPLLGPHQRKRRASMRINPPKKEEGERVGEALLLERRKESGGK